jgi:hypothetical protein
MGRHPLEAQAFTLGSRHQYITWGWESWGANFVTRFVSQAWSKNYIPVISVYMMLAVPPSTGEGAAPYAAKLQNATTVSDYLASLARAAAQAKGSKPVIFHIEPDFYGFMQQYKYSGNMSLDNTPQHYQDNRPAYAFSHPRELADAGVIGVLFGGGDGNSTEPSTDGGFIAAHGAIAYTPPAAPSGLAISAVTGPTVALHWNPNGEEDLWGYRISYQPTGGDPASSTDVVRATQSSILLPRAGSWRITIAAYDAMGRLGPSSAAVTATTTSNASQVVVPLVRR